MTKVSLRQRILLERKNLPLDAYRSRSRQAQQRLSVQSCFKAAQSVAMYSPVRGEIDTLELLELALGLGKKVFFPKVSGSDLQFFQIETTQDMLPGAFGVLEPASSAAAATQAFDLMIVPGIAFDLAGNRLGYGKGYYDRWLATRRPLVTVGLAFELQIVRNLPAETHDQQLDFIATETRFIPCHNGVAGSI